MTGFTVKTFGCKVNTYDSGLLQKKLRESGFSLKGAESSEVVILNSCAVTAEATKEVLRQARRQKKENPKSLVVLTGCAAQVDGELVDQSPDVDLVVANSHKGNLAEILKAKLQSQDMEKVFRSNIFRNEDLGEGGGEEEAHTRSYLKIQDGCNSFCSFCIIPFARGKSRSLQVPALLHKIRKLHEGGVNEVVLTGVHIGDYCDDVTYGGPFHLDDLVEQVLRNTQMPRIRLSSLEPIELTDKLIDLYENPRMCPHFHMSLQSLSSPVLKSMRRNYTAEQVETALKTIHRRFPQAFVGLDVITGFPGETEALFQETYENLKAWPWTRIHVFPYSERKGTRAVQLSESVPWCQRKERARLLRELSHERYDQLASEQLGGTKQVLVLKSDSDLIRTLTHDYWPLYLQENSKELQVGQIYEAKVKGYVRAQGGRSSGHLWGALL